MRYPKDLAKGGTIGFLAPSFGCNTEPYRSAFDHALDRWQGMGYRTVTGPNCYVGEGVGISNTPEKCAAEVMEMFCGKEADVLISCGGGELMCEILEHVDFRRLAQADPKWFMGYSDNTNLVYPLVTLCDTAAIYGPCAAAFGMEPWHSSIGDAYQLLTGEKRVVESYPLWEKESRKDEEHPLEPYYVTEPFTLRTRPQTESLTMEGRLIGGCLDCLNNIVGTRFDKVSDSFVNKYKEDGFLWFLEACDLNVMDMRRSLWHLKEAGWFQYAKGFLIGRPAHYDEPMMGLDQYEAVCGVLEEYGVPVLMDLDIGHVAPSMPLISGSMATVSVCGNAVQVQMDLR